MFASTLKKDSKDLFDQEKAAIFEECQKAIKALWNKAWADGDQKWLKNYDKLDSISILNAIEAAIEKAKVEKTNSISSLSINGVDIAITYELKADKAETDEILTGTSSTPLSFFSSGSSTPSSRSGSPTAYLTRKFSNISIGSVFNSNRGSSSKKDSRPASPNKP